MPNKCDETTLDKKLRLVHSPLFSQYFCWEPIKYTGEQKSNKSLDFMQSLFLKEWPLEKKNEWPSLTDDQVHKSLSLSTLLMGSMQRGSKFSDNMDVAKHQLIEIRG